MHPHTRSASREQQLCSAVSLHEYLCPSSAMEVPRIGSDPSTHKELAGDPPLTDLATAGVWVLFIHLPHHPGFQRPALFLGYLLQLVRPFQKVLFLYLAEKRDPSSSSLFASTLARTSLSCSVCGLAASKLPRFLHSQRRCFSSAHASALNFVELRQASSPPVVGAPGPRLLSVASLLKPAVSSTKAAAS